MSLPEEQHGGVTGAAGLYDIARVREEYPASRWSLKGSVRIESALDGLDGLSDPAVKAHCAQNRFEAFKKRYGLAGAPGKLRVLMIAADTGGCGFARIERPARYLNRHPQVAAFPTVKITPELIHWAHVIVWQRQHKDDMLPVFEMGKRLQRVQIFDIDDNLHAIPRHNPAYVVYNRETKPYRDLLSWMRRCDLVTVSKGELGEFYREFAGIRYAVLPNCIDFGEFPASAGPSRTDNRVRIGWAGSATHHEDLRIVAGVLWELKKTYGERIELVMMGSDGIRRTYQKIDPHGPGDESNLQSFAQEDVLKGIEREFHEPVPTEDYGRALCGLDLDIAVIPLARSKFNLSGKSNIKYLEMSAAKVPCVLSVDTVYDEVRHGETGFLAGKGREWLLCLEQLIQDPALRLRIAENAHGYVRAHYNFADKIQEWAKVYRQVWKAKREAQ